MSALPLLIITREGETIRSQAVDAEISIGRAEGNVIRLEDRAVSRNHAIIRKTSEGVQIEKQSDFAPIRLNGEECTRALIKEGDIVDIGPFRMRLDAKEVKQEVRHEAKHAPLAAATDATLVLGDNQLQIADALPTDLQGALDSPMIGDFGTAGPDIVQPIMGDSAGAEVAAQDPGTSIFQDQNVQITGDDAPPLDIDFGHLSGDQNAESGTPVDENAATRVLKSTVDACLRIAPGLAHLEKLDLTKSEIFIGRGKECDLVLNDKKSSRKNAVITRVGNRYVLKDLESSNGTFLNGESVKEAELSADDVIRIGEVEIHFIALNPDYERKKDQFLSVSEAESLAPSGEHSDEQLIQGTPIGSMDPTSESTPEPQTRKGLSGIYDKYLKNFSTLKPGQKVLVVLMVGLFLSWYFEDELGLVEKPKAKPPVVRKSVDGKPSVTADFDSLPPEKRQQIDDAIRRGTDSLRLQDFDKAIYEVKTFVYPIIADFGRAKEIERYAIEGKRRKDAIEEEAKKKEAERKLKERIAELEIQTKDFMGQKKYEQAKETFGEILALDPDNVSVAEWKREIDTWMEEQSRLQQEKLVQEEINKRAWDTYNEGFELHKAGKYRAAMEIYKKIPELGVDDKILLKKTATMLKTCQESNRRLREPHVKPAKRFEQNSLAGSAF